MLGSRHDSVMATKWTTIGLPMTATNRPVSQAAAIMWKKRQPYKSFTHRSVELRFRLPKARLIKESIRVSVSFSVAANKGVKSGAVAAEQQCILGESLWGVVRKELFSVAVLFWLCKSWELFKDRAVFIFAEHPLTWVLHFTFTGFWHLKDEESTPRAQVAMCRRTVQLW